MHAHTHKDTHTHKDRHTNTDKDKHTKTRTKTHKKRHTHAHVRGCVHGLTSGRIECVCRCGWNHKDSTIFFTINGETLGTAFYGVMGRSQVGLGVRGGPCVCHASDRCVNSVMGVKELWA